jgi:hypothetical protein
MTVRAYAEMDESLRYMGCQWILGEGERKSQCGRSVAYFVTVDGMVSTVCEEHAAVLREANPQWFEGITPAGPWRDPYDD